ncbi:hypothetical protein LguiB_006305 [Lonicera macranthoides]
MRCIHLLLIIIIPSVYTFYRGILDLSERVVVVKVFNLDRQGASESFVDECEVLRNVRHRNIIKIITSCSTIDFQGNEFKALVYEFVPNGSLERWLHSSREANSEPIEHRTLNLQQRVNIAIDVACALNYLHNSCGRLVIHCDLKPNNILLYRDMVAHLGDFDQARLLEPTEYGLGGEISTKGDVYNYGILILAMITPKRPTDPLFKEGHTLHSYARSSLPDNVPEIVDPMRLINIKKEASTIAANDNQRWRERNNIIAECLISVVKIGVACSMELAQDQIGMIRVVRKLHSVKKVLRN